MKVEANKCEYCGFITMDEGVFLHHHDICVATDKLKKQFNIGIVHSGETIQRDKRWYDNYKAAVLDAVAIHNYDYPPLSYGWWRSLDDGHSKLYGPALVLLEVCQKCWKQHDQQYHANHCTC